MVQIGSKDPGLSRSFSAGTSRQDGKPNHSTNFGPSSQLAYSSGATKVQTFRGPRRVLSFGATPTGGVSELIEDASRNCSDV